MQPSCWWVSRHVFCPYNSHAALGKHALQSENLCSRLSQRWHPAAPVCIDSKDSLKTFSLRLLAFGTCVTVSKRDCILCYIKLSSSLQRELWVQEYYIHASMLQYINVLFLFHTRHEKNPSGLTYHMWHREQDICHKGRKDERLKRWVSQRETSSFLEICFCKLLKEMCISAAVGSMKRH